MTEHSDAIRRNAPGALGRGRLLAIWLGLAAVVVLLFVLELAIGSVRIDPGQVLSAALGRLEDSGARTILLELRLPRALAAALVGAALGVCGLQLQTLFRNPLAGPWALGITAGAQVGVAFTVMAAAVVGSEFLRSFADFGSLGTVAGASIGAAAVMTLMAAASRRVSTVALLILGLMLSFMAEGLVSALLHFTNETQARIYASWSDGSYSGVTWNELRFLAPFVVVGLLLSVALAKQLNALLLGENYARTMGVDVGFARLATLASVVVLAGPVTAYCGPITFLGIITPHICRGLLRTSDHRILTPAVTLAGAALGLVGDLVVHGPWERHFLHLNPVNALIGGPIVIAVILRQRRLGGL